MKFRIIKYYDRFMPQVGKEVFNGVRWEDEWTNIGSPNGYNNVDEAKSYCTRYK